MILNKILAAIKNKRLFDIKYIIVELVLIFTGITLAASYNDYKNDQQDKKFVKETMVQMYQEIKKNDFANKLYTKGQRDRVAQLKKVKEYILTQNKKALLSKEVMLVFSSLITTITLDNYHLGYTKLINKDINLVKEEEVKNDIIRYYTIMGYCEEDLNGYNNQILETKPFLIKHFVNINIMDHTYAEIKNIDLLINDYEFLNYLNLTINSLELNIESNEKGVLPMTTKLLKTLEEYYPYLAELPSEIKL